MLNVFESTLKSTFMSRDSATGWHYAMAESSDTVIKKIRLDKKHKLWWPICLSLDCRFNKNRL